MKHATDELIELIAASELEKALKKMHQICSLGGSELTNDAVMLLAQWHKLESDTRKGILNYDQENLTRNRITNSALELVEMLRDQPSLLRGVGELEDGLDQAATMRQTLRQMYGQELQLDRATRQKKNKPLSAAAKEALFERMTFVKLKNIAPRVLWIDDYPESNDAERKILESIGLHIVLTGTSEAAARLLRDAPPDLVISDIWREGNPAEGIEFHRRWYDEGQAAVPFIFYLSYFRPERGTPPLAFGITDLPGELIHLVLDLVERRF
jgi:CheY-like chemotaxis protein